MYSPWPGVGVVSGPPVPLQPVLLQPQPSTYFSSLPAVYNTAASATPVKSRCGGVWDEYFDPTQHRFYYCNTETSKCTWKKPASFDLMHARLEALQRRPASAAKFEQEEREEDRVAVSPTLRTRGADRAGTNTARVRPRSAAATSRATNMRDRNSKWRNGNSSSKPRRPQSAMPRFVRDSHEFVTHNHAIYQSFPPQLQHPAYVVYTTPTHQPLPLTMDNVRRLQQLQDIQQREQLRQLQAVNLSPLASPTYAVNTMAPLDVFVERQAQSPQQPTVRGRTVLEDRRMQNKAATLIQSHVRRREAQLNVASMREKRKEAVIEVQAHGGRLRARARADKFMGARGTQVPRLPSPCYAVEHTDDVEVLSMADVGVFMEGHQILLGDGTNQLDVGEVTRFDVARKKHLVRWKSSADHIQPTEGQYELQWVDLRDKTYHIIQPELVSGGNDLLGRSCFIQVQVEEKESRSGQRTGTKARALSDGDAWCKGRIVAFDKMTGQHSVVVDNRAVQGGGSSAASLTGLTVVAVLDDIVCLLVPIKKHEREHDLVQREELHSRLCATENERRWWEEAAGVLKSEQQKLLEQHRQDAAALAESRAHAKQLLKDQQAKDLQWSKARTEARNALGEMLHAVEVLEAERKQKQGDMGHAMLERIRVTEARAAELETKQAKWENERVNARNALGTMLQALELVEKERNEAVALAKAVTGRTKDTAKWENERVNARNALGTMLQALELVEKERDEAVALAKAVTERTKDTDVAQKS